MSLQETDILKAAGLWPQVWIGDGMRYHVESCVVLANPNNHLVQVSLDSAVIVGYTPCHLCVPPTS